MHDEAMAPAPESPWDSPDFETIKAESAKIEKLWPRPHLETFPRVEAALAEQKKSWELLERLYNGQLQLQSRMFPWLNKLVSWRCLHRPVEMWAHPS